jgi:hypothetical protein
MSNQDTADSPQVKLIRSVIDGFGERNVDRILDQLHKDHRFITYPRSLGRPEYTKEEWALRLKELVGLLPEGAEVNYTGFYRNALPPGLNHSRSRPFILSPKLRGRSSFTFVSPTFGSTRRVLTRSTQFIAHHQREVLSRGGDGSRNDPHYSKRYRRRRKPKDQENGIFCRLQSLP